MMEFLENLKQKPQHIKKGIFIAVMIFFTATVVFVWIISAGNSIDDLSGDDRGNSLFSEKVNLPNLSDSLKASASAVFNGKDIRIK